MRFWFTSDFLAGVSVDFFDVFVGIAGNPEIGRYAAFFWILYAVFIGK
jgi:hypothetical protein